MTPPALPVPRSFEEAILHALEANAYMLAACALTIHSSSAFHSYTQIGLVGRTGSDGVPQDEARATHATLLTKEMGALDWTEPAQALHDPRHVDAAAARKPLRMGAAQFVAGQQLLAGCGHVECGIERDRQDVGHALTVDHGCGRAARMPAAMARVCAVPAWRHPAAGPARKDDTTWRISCWCMAHGMAPGAGAT